MRGMLAVRLIASWVFVIGSARIAAAQTGSGGATGGWNDPRSRALVELATKRRAEQLADTGLVDYRASARGYVTFLAAMGDGFLETPKVVKTDQLALEVYWHAPNLSKQRIIGRRDTLLLPTDIRYHRDHLGIVQNNFPDFIRIGEGDEVRDVPHPLSAAGLALYDYQLSRDSIRIGLPGQNVDLLEVKVRPKDDREPRIIGSIFIDPREGQVVRMAFNFTRAAFLDKELEDLAIVLENRLVGSRFWLPSRQEIEIRRTGSWLDFPVRGIIRGRWEIGDYQFNLAVPAQVFAGPEIVFAPPQELKKYPWQGTIMDSLPADVRGTVDPDIQRVLEDARVLVRAQALQRVQTLRLSARRVSDFVRVNRAEGLAIGSGFSAKVAPSLFVIARARYGIDDREVKGLAQLRWMNPSGSFIELFGSRENVDIGDQPERSPIINSFAAQEFGSDLTDPYRVDIVGLHTTIRRNGFDLGVSSSSEWHHSVSVHASPMRGAFEATPSVSKLHGARFALSLDRPLKNWTHGGMLQVAAKASILLYDMPSTVAIDPGIDGAIFRTSLRASLTAEHRSHVGSSTLVIREQAGGVTGDLPLAVQEYFYYGGPVSAPGYQLHSIAARVGSATQVELQLPVPFIPIPLGRFGRVPGQARLAPFVGTVLTDGGGVYPSAGLGLLTVFDALRFDVARGFKGGRWFFNVDLSRDFWSIL